MANIINFHDALRARLSQMADEHYAMQEAMVDLPAHEVEAHCARMTAHASEMSKLASRLDGESIERKALSFEVHNPDLNARPSTLDPNDDPEAA